MATNYATETNIYLQNAISMFKEFRLVDPKLPRTARGQRIENTDWERCIMCQENKSEVLQCPADSSRSDAGVGYMRFEENFKRFKELGALPVKIHSKEEV